MATSALKISSKGQITIPLKVRQRLGVKPGDKVELIEQEGLTILKPAKTDENPFDKWIGVLTLPEGMSHDEWFHSMRYPDDEPYE